MPDPCLHARFTCPSCGVLLGSPVGLEDPPPALGGIGLTDDEAAEFWAALHPPDRDDRRIEVARLVARHHRVEVSRWPDLAWAAHPLTHVLNALDGVTDPTDLGIDPDSPDVDRIRKVAT